MKTYTIVVREINIDWRRLMTSSFEDFTKKAEAFLEEHITEYLSVDMALEDFARQYTGKTINLNDPKKACEIFEEVEQINHKHAVVTLGEKGLLYRRDGKITLMPAFKVKAVDTNGAGDIFHGAFAYAIKQQLDFYDVLKISSMASAISVQTLGAQSSIPQLTKVTSELQKKGNHYDKRRYL